MKWGIANMTWEAHRSIAPFFQPSGLYGAFRGRDGALFAFWLPISEETFEGARPEDVRWLLEAAWLDFRYMLDRRYDVRMTWTLPLAKTW